MPWQECQKMDERLRFVARLLEGEKMAALCREFDISRQTGHKFYKRYKDEFMLADHRYCYPLTITDFASRYLLCCEGLQNTRELIAFSVFERTFKDYGLPRAIRSDNGVPFASTSAFFGLSKLSVWWLRLGIAIERIKPAHPEQNGRHERMHLTLKKEATKPAGKNFLQQQARFDAFTRVYNYVSYCPTYLCV